MFGARNRKKVDVDSRDASGPLPVRKGNTESVRIFFRSTEKVAGPPDTIHPFEMFIEVTRNVFQMESHRSILFFFHE